VASDDSERRLDASISDTLDGERVDRTVALLADLSRTDAARLVDAGEVRVDGQVVSSGKQRVHAGQTLSVTVPEPVDDRPQADAGIDIDVRHLDDHVIVVDKPAGLVVHPGAGHRSGTLVNGLLARFPELAGVGDPQRPGIVHRLDRGTSGLLMVARTPSAYEGLVEQLQRHEPERTYDALGWGHLEADRGTIDAPIGRSSRHPTRFTVTDRGRRAVTHYEVVDRFSSPVDATLLRCRLETGRTHQIRVHLRAIGHPVVGDRDYDGGRPGLDPGRPFLHAGSLRFTHPVTGDGVEVTSALPDGLRSLVDACS